MAYKMYKQEAPHHFTVEELTDKMSELCDVVEQQKTLISKLTQQISNNNSQKNFPTPSSFVVKPRDIPVLTLEELEGIEAGGKLAMFIDRVEQVTPDEVIRLQVAKTRLDTKIALLVQNIQNNGGISSWTEFKTFLTTEFAREMTVDRAWQEIENTHYEWETSPQSFVHQISCRYALLETNFPREKFPNKDQITKRKICQGLPPQARGKLEAFLEETYPLKKFLERVEYERQFLVEGPECDLFHVKKKFQTPPQTKTSSQKPLSFSNGETNSRPVKEETRAQPVNPLMWEVKELARRVDELTKQRSSRRWCHNCRKDNHNTQECWSRPRNRS